MSDILNENTFYYFFSTISQTYVALIAAVGVIVVFRMDGLNKQIQNILNTIIGYREQRDLTVEEAFNEKIFENKELYNKRFYEPIIDFYPIRDVFDETDDEQFFKDKYKSLLYLSGLIDYNFHKYKCLCLTSFILIFSSIAGLSLSVNISMNCFAKCIIAIFFILYCFGVLYFAFENLKVLFIASEIDSEIIIKRRKKTIGKILQDRGIPLTYP